MTNLLQKNVNSIRFGKEIVHVNHVLIPGSPILKQKSLEDCSFSVHPKRTVKLQNSVILWNFLGSFQKSSAIVRSSSETLALGRKKISRLWLTESWQLYIVQLYVERAVGINFFKVLKKIVCMPVSVPEYRVPTL